MEGKVFGGVEAVVGAPEEGRHDRGFGDVVEPLDRGLFVLVEGSQRSGDSQDERESFGQHGVRDRSTAKVQVAVVVASRYSANEIVLLQAEVIEGGQVIVDDSSFPFFIDLSGDRSLMVQLVIFELRGLCCDLNGIRNHQIEMFGKQAFVGVRLAHVAVISVHQQIVSTPFTEE
uniref:(northern house mosquito) hypothetical protein n=1 Tax=Culex pipiens TaxID=7175 RepID=A0A8D8EWW8_CULPI